MRIAFQTSYRNSLADIQQTSEDLARYQRQVSSGKRLELPSDDPTAAATAVGEHAEIGTIDQYIKAADSVGSRLAVVDTVLSDIVDQITRAQASAVGALGTTATAAQRESIAHELEGIRTALLGDFNTMFHGTYLFSGTNQTVAPYTLNPDGTVSAYQGNTSPLLVDVDRNTAVRVSYDGSAIAQGGDAGHIFAAFDALVADVRAGNTTGVQAGIDALKRGFDRAVLAQTRVGNDEAALEGQRSRLAALRLSSLKRLTAAEDANMAEAISGASRADTAHKAALAAISQIANVSLLDYLK